jgi:hypothetical protein
LKEIGSGVRASRLIALARVLAWFAGYGAAFMVAYAYAALPDDLPLSRWTNEPRSLFFALRIPAINLLMIGLADLLARALSRSPSEHRTGAEWAGATLLCTAGVKAWLAAREILAWPHPSPLIRVGGVLSVVIGIGLAAFFARPLFAPDAYRQVRWTRIEMVLAVTLVAGVLLLNLPLALAG